MGRLSIKGHLKKARTRGKAASILSEWSNSYQNQFHGLIRKMNKAKKEGDLRTLGFCIGELDGLQKKLFTGFSSIAQQLIQPDLPALDPEDKTPLWSEEED